jgi:hypothetical protein
MNAFSGSSLSSNGPVALEDIPVAVPRRHFGLIEEKEIALDWPKIVSRLTRLGVSPANIDNSRRDAHRNGSCVTRELIALGLLDETAYYQSLAIELGLEFVETVDPNSLIMLPGHDLSTIRNAATIKALAKGGESILFTAPDDQQLVVLIRNLQRYPSRSSPH